MKVVLKLAVEVDPEKWDLAYGTGTAYKAVRDDVLTYVVGQVQYSPAAEEGGIVSAEIVTSASRTRRS